MEAKRIPICQQVQEDWKGEYTLIVKQTYEIREQYGTRMWHGLQNTLQYIWQKKPFAPYVTALSTWKCLEWQAKKPRENYTREFQERWNRATLGKSWFLVKALRSRGTPESTEDTINAISVDGTTINLSANLAG